MKSKIIGIIPARYNSSRFLGKLLYKIGSKTLLEHTYENAKACDIFDELFIVTEDENIKEETKPDPYRKDLDISAFIEKFKL